VLHTAKFKRTGALTMEVDSAALTGGAWHMMSKQNNEALFSPMRSSSLAVRLAQEFGYLARELMSHPLSYLRVAFLPDSLEDWLPFRLARELNYSLSSMIAHPVAFIAGAFSPDEIERKRRPRLARIMAASAFVHFLLVSYLLYMAFISPFAGIRVVEKKYRQIDTATLLAPLRYPRQALRGPVGNAMTLEQIRERERKRREQIERRRREEEERRRREEEARKEAERKAQEENKTNPSTQFGEINVNPIKDIIGKLYEAYQAGQLDLDVTNLKVMATFKIDKDGSIPISSIKIIKSSGSKKVDQTAIEILWRLGESHGLGPLSDLSSNTIQLEVTDKIARLTITSFAPTPNDARAKAELLNSLISVLKWMQKSKNPAVAELLGHLRVTSNNNRVDAEMSVSRQRASELMQAQFGKSLNAQ
jgi:hypothetical protein